MLKTPLSYELIAEEDLKDLNGKGYLLKHKKTGARIVLIDCEDTNKVFNIGFRTPPKDSTGVAHILEHSVLCGSRQFPAKDPFIELAKGSLNTFLNAMTYSDRTLYPLASQNDQDFKNLMHVYMDAVFHPNIYERREIFEQEGWHYEMESADSELKINGVVYNEMKGAFSSPEQQLYRLNQNSLFPDTSYGVESGGDPRYIPDLTYENFIDFHKTYYHPSNSYIYLYGNMDFEERLLWMEEEYLSHYDYLKVDSELRLHKPFGEIREIREEYSIGEEESGADSTYLSYNLVLGNNPTKELKLAFTLIDYVLLDAPGAPLKQALLDAGIGKDILSSYSGEYLQSTLSIIAKNSEESKKEEFLQIIRTELERAVSAGLDAKSLEGAINFYEFRYREADFGSYPKGLMYGLRLMSSWVYNELEPFANLKDSELFTNLRKKIGTGYYERIIEDFLLRNNHASLVILSPKQGLSGETETKLKEKLTKYKETLTDEQKNAIVEATHNLKKYQEEPSPKEDMEKIPMLSRADIGREALPIFNEEKEIQGIRMIHHELFTNEIAYVKLLFNIKEIPAGLIPYASLLTWCMGYMNTEQYSYLEFSNEVNIHTGGITSDIRCFAKVNQPEDYHALFMINAKAMYNQLPQVFRLIEEMVYHTLYDNGKRLREIMEEIKSRMQMRFNSSGHGVAVDRASAYASEQGLFEEYISGIAFYNFIESLMDNFDEKKDSIMENLRILTRLIFTKENVSVSLTSDAQGYEQFEESFVKFISVLKDEDQKIAAKFSDKGELQSVGMNEGLKTAMQIQYVARTGNYKKAGFAYTGVLRVVQGIFGYDYLWNNVRVKGGAYGCMCGFNRVSGESYFTSYRDPNLRETNQIYEKAPEFIKNFTADEREMTRNIIGAISTVDTPLTPQGNGYRSLSMYLYGVTMKEIQEERDQIINATQEDIRQLHPLIQSILDADNICVIGNERKIEENRDLFKEVKVLIK